VGGDIYGYKYCIIVSRADNYGTYQKPFRSEFSSTMLEVSKRFEKAWGLEFSLAIAGDIGTQYGNSFGGYLRITKTGLITTY
jgi:hypothetical protein